MGKCHREGRRQASNADGRMTPKVCSSCLGLSRCGVHMPGMLVQMLYMPEWVDTVWNPGCCMWGLAVVGSGWEWMTLCVR